MVVQTTREDRTVANQSEREARRLDTLAGYIKGADRKLNYTGRPELDSLINKGEIVVLADRLINHSGLYPEGPAFRHEKLSAVVGDESILVIRIVPTPYSSPSTSAL